MPNDRPLPTIHQTATGNYIAQAAGPNARAEVNVVAQPEPVPAVPPSPDDHFVGRTDQLTDLTQLLTDGLSAAVQGMGGIGKTALALKLADQIRGHFSGGIFWADLAATDGAIVSILQSWAYTCGADLRQEPDEQVLLNTTRTLLDRHRQKLGPLLVVLDDVRGEPPAWLENAQRLRRAVPDGIPVLFTTRDLQIADTFDADLTIQLDLLPHEFAEQLLLAHAGPDVSLVTDPALDDLLKVLGYLPLAIRLAGKQLRHRARKGPVDLATYTDQISSHTDQALTALRGEQRGLYATFSISYDVLSDDQQQIYRRLSVWSPALLNPEHIAALVDLDPTLLENQLDELVDLALADWVDGNYVVHPLLRSYAHDRLAQDEGDARPIHRRAAAYLQTKATTDGQTITPAEALEEVDQWKKADARHIFALRAFDLVGSLTRLGYWTEIDVILQDAICSIQDLDEIEQLRAQLLSGRGALSIMSANWDEAVEFYQQALDAKRALEDSHGVAQIIGNLGSVYADKGDWGRAFDYYEQSLELLRQVGDPHDIALALGNLGSVSLHKGEWDCATVLFQESMEMLEQLGDSRGVATSCHNQGLVCVGKGELNSAINLFRQSLRLLDQVGDFHFIAQVFNSLGGVYARESDWRRAVDLYEQSLAISEKIGDMRRTAQTLGNIALIHMRKGEWLLAIRLYEQSFERYEQVGDIRSMAEVMRNLGIAYQAQDNIDQAVHSYATSYLIDAHLDQSEHQQVFQLLVDIVGSVDAAQSYIRQVSVAQDEPASQTANS